jgi:hypothetical protein
MTTERATTIDAYLQTLPHDRMVAINLLRDVINARLPKGFSEQITYGMIGWVVPHSTYPAGYHCDPKLPLPFLSIASQKSFIAVYHMGMYAEPELLNWFMEEFPKHSKLKPDMGKSCIRFKKIDQIPYALIGELAGKMSPEAWIELYERMLKK